MKGSFEVILFKASSQPKAEMNNYQLACKAYREVAENHTGLMSLGIWPWIILAPTLKPQQLKEKYMEN